VPNAIAKHKYKDEIRVSEEILLSDLLVVHLVRVVASRRLLLGHGAQHGRVLGRMGEVVVDIATVFIFLVRETIFIDLLLGLLRFPVGSHVVDLRVVVEFRVILLANSSPALPQRKVVRVDSNTVVFVSATLTDILPSTLLLFEVETSGIWEPDGSQDHTSKTEPGDNVELLLNRDVIVQNRSEQCTELANGSGETVGGGANGGWVNLSGDEEGDSIRAKLVEERG